MHTRLMKTKPSQKDWLPLSKPQKTAVELPTGEAFNPQWIDFERGIRVGNLEPHERITQILKYGLEQMYGTPFVTDRWGRGTFWQWICWLSRSNREAKPISHNVNFGCAKFFISLDREQLVFQCGMTIERGYAAGRPSIPGILLKKDWDWHRLMAQCRKGTELDETIGRLIRRDGFLASVTGSSGTTRYSAKNFANARQIRETARKAAPNDWAGFSLFYPMPKSEVYASSGYDLVQGIRGVFAEVSEAMNQCMQVKLREIGFRPAPPALSS